MSLNGEFLATRNSSFALTEHLPQIQTKFEYCLIIPSQFHFTVKDRYHEIIKWPNLNSVDCFQSHPFKLWPPLFLLTKIAKLPLSSSSVMKKRFLLLVVCLFLSLLQLILPVVFRLRSLWIAYLFIPLVKKITVCTEAVEGCWNY